MVASKVMENCFFVVPLEVDEEGVLEETTALLTERVIMAVAEFPLSSVTVILMVNVPSLFA